MMQALQSVDPDSPQFGLPVVGGAADGTGVEQGRSGYDGLPLGAAIGAIGTQPYSEQAHAQHHHIEGKDMAYIELAGALLGLAVLVVTLVKQLQK